MFSTVGHFLASIFKGALRVAGIIAQDATTPTPLLDGLTPLQVGEAIATKINPNSTLVINAGMALLGQFAALYNDGKLVLNGGFTNLALDAATFSIAEKAIPEVIAFFNNPTKNPVRAPANG